jgi:endonuclease/exonuclease/phosphatase family metal-dependent hydrolase
MMIVSRRRILACFVLLCIALICGRAASQELATFRVMTYNIHHGEGTDGKLDLERIAALIKAERADIVALQEVDRGTARTAKRDLAKELAELTDMQQVFGKNIDFQGGEYGNAILSRFPIVEHAHTRYRISISGEQRGLLQALIRVHGQELLLLNTHLDFKKEDEERLANAAEALAILAERQPKRLVIFCGDFNAPLGSPTYKAVVEKLDDCWPLAGEGPGFTIPSQWPAARIDYVFIDKESALRPRKAWVPRSIASDHLPVVVEFELPLAR